MRSCSTASRADRSQRCRRSIAPGVAWPSPPPVASLGVDLTRAVAAERDGMRAARCVAVDPECCRKDLAGGGWREVHEHLYRPAGRERRLAELLPPEPGHGAGRHADDQLSLARVA